ncbi:MAG: type II toxin-antitoxin system RelE/ParE family toxin [Bacteroidales bacterium]|jgi:phage-related protein|nr:type II toxin-antitoxin system RelE/ParE family toxin [Bacteroidales bacterium]MBO5854620.1 type II toxin-antitoxin system RelE/ParE family toxin [Bacteroidales bacterium]
MRTIYRSMEFDLFYNSLSNKIQNKIDYALNIISEIKIINSKLAKKLKNTNLYELRISIENEYRILLFTIDNESLIECNEIILLNGFIKKSTKDYKKEIHKAQQILNSLT